MDEASTKTYLNTDVASELGLNERTEEVRVNVLNGQTETFETQPVSFELLSIDRKVNMSVTAYTANRVTGDMPVINWNEYTAQWPYLRRVDFPVPAEKPIVDILIGLDCLDLHCAIAEVNGRPGEPVSRLTPLGWTCIGNPYSAKIQTLLTHFAYTCFVRGQPGIERPNSNQTRFRTIEEIPSLDSKPEKRSMSMDRSKSKVRSKSIKRSKSRESHKSRKRSDSRKIFESRKSSESRDRSESPNRSQSTEGKISISRKSSESKMRSKSRERFDSRKRPESRERSEFRNSFESNKKSEPKQRPGSRKRFESRQRSESRQTLELMQRPRQRSNRSSGRGRARGRSLSRGIGRTRGRGRNRGRDRSPGRGLSGTSGRNRGRVRVDEKVEGDEGRGRSQNYVLLKERCVLTTKRKLYRFK